MSAIFSASFSCCSTSLFSHESQASRLRFNRLRVSSNEVNVLGNKSVRFISSSPHGYGGSCRKSTMFRNFKVYNGASPVSPPPPPNPSPGSWKFWILGVLLSAVLPFWKSSWNPLMRIKERLETVAERADEVTNVIEKVADDVEKVAEEVEKVAEKVADHLPEGGKLKTAALFVEVVAKKTAEEANVAGDIIDKVQDVVKEVEEFTGKDESNRTKEAIDKKLKDMTKN